MMSTLEDKLEEALGIKLRGLQATILLCSMSSGQHEVTTKGLGPTLESSFLIIFNGRFA